jgi:hypothetical protein
MLQARGVAAGKGSSGSGVDVISTNEFVILGTIIVRYAKGTKQLFWNGK